MPLADTTEKIVVLGAGGTGLLVADTLERTPGLAFAGFLDDDAAKQRDGYAGYPVLGPLASWRTLPPGTKVLNSLYSPKRMAFFASLVAALGIPRERWATVADPRAVVSSRAQLGAGVYVGPGTVVEPLVRIGDLSFVYGATYLAHHTALGQFVLCANSAAIAGGVTIGDQAYIGANASVREYLQVGAGAVVGMGSVVVRDVAPGATVAGNPAKALPATARP